MVIKETELREILQCTKMTSYNKLRYPERFTFREINMIKDHYGLDYNGACGIINDTVDDYLRRTRRK